MNQLVLNHAIQKMRRVVHKRLAKFDGETLDDVWLGLRIHDPDVTDKGIQDEIQRALDGQRQAHWSRKYLLSVLPRVSGKGPIK